MSGAGLNLFDTVYPPSTGWRSAKGVSPLAAVGLTPHTMSRDGYVTWPDMMTNTANARRHARGLAGCRVGAARGRRPGGMRDGLPSFSAGLSLSKEHPLEHIAEDDLVTEGD